MNKLKAVLDRVLAESAPKARSLAEERERQRIGVEERQRRQLEDWRVERQRLLRPIADRVWEWVVAFHATGAPHRIGDALRALGASSPEPVLLEIGNGYNRMGIRLGVGDEPSLIAQHVTGHLAWARTVSTSAASVEQLTEFPFDERILRQLARDVATGELLWRAATEVERAESEALAHATRGES